MKYPFLALLMILFFCLSNTMAQDSASVSDIDMVSCAEHDTVVQVLVEKNAEFQGGDILKFRDYVMHNIRYPVPALENNYQGSVTVKFVVDWDGRVRDVEVLKSSGYNILDKEAVRVIQDSPEWVSAKNDNVCVPQQFTLPVQFISLGIINRQ